MTHLTKTYKAYPPASCSWLLQCQNCCHVASLNCSCNSSLLKLIKSCSNELVAKLSKPLISRIPERVPRGRPRSFPSFKGLPRGSGHQSVDLLEKSACCLILKHFHLRSLQDIACCPETNVAESPVNSSPSPEITEVSNQLLPGSQFPKLL